MRARDDEELPVALKEFHKLQVMVVNINRSSAWKYLHNPTPYLRPSWNASKLKNVPSKAHSTAFAAQMMLIALLLLLSHAHLSPGEVVRFTHDGVSVDTAWNEAGADFQQSLDDVCSHFEAFDSCASALLDHLLAADLRLWNARDGKNLTWAQRPPRLMPEHMRDRFTRSGTIQQLQSYTDQSQPNCEIHQAYSGDEIDGFINRVRARAYGPSYPEVDFYIYQRTIESCFGFARAFVS